LGPPRDIRHQGGRTHDCERERCGSEELPKALARVLGIGKTRRSEHVVMSAEEDRELDHDKGEEERVEEREWDSPLPRREPARWSR